MILPDGHPGHMGCDEAHKSDYAREADDAGSDEGGDDQGNGSDPGGIDAQALCRLIAPAKMAFRSQERRINKGTENSSTTKTMVTLSQSAPESVPKVQLTMALSCCSLAKNCKIAVRLPKK